MDKCTVNYIIDIGLGISFILAFFTGIIKWPRFIRIFGMSYSDLPMKVITGVHDFSGLVMGLLVLVHIILHWKWIVLFTRRIFYRKGAQNSEGKNED